MDGTRAAAVPAEQAEVPVAVVQRLCMRGVQKWAVQTPLLPCRCHHRMLRHDRERWRCMQGYARPKQRAAARLTGAAAWLMGEEAVDRKVVRGWTSSSHEVEAGAGDGDGAGQRGALEVRKGSCELRLAEVETDGCHGRLAGQSLAAVAVVAVVDVAGAVGQVHLLLMLSQHS